MIFSVFVFVSPGKLPAYQKYERKEPVRNCTLPAFQPFLLAPGLSACFTSKDGKEILKCFLSLSLFAFVSLPYAGIEKIHS
jgi:hypothetical protein